MKKGFKVRVPKDGLYDLLLKRIFECKETNQKDEFIKIKKVTRKICTSFQLKKNECFQILFLLNDLELIEFSNCHGLTLNYEIVDNEIKILDFENNFNDINKKEDNLI